MGTHPLPLGQKNIWKHPRQGAPERSRSGLECVQNPFGSAQAASGSTSAASKGAYSRWKTGHTEKITQQCRKNYSFVQVYAQTFVTKIMNNKLGNAFRKKCRTAVPLWPDGARKAPPGCPGAHPRALRERLGSVREHPGSVRASLLGEENWARAKNMIFF